MTRSVYLVACRRDHTSRHCESSEVVRLSVVPIVVPLTMVRRVLRLAMIRSLIDSHGVAIQLRVLRRVGRIDLGEDDVKASAAAVLRAITTQLAADSAVAPATLWGTTYFLCLRVRGGEKSSGGDRDGK